MKIGVLTWHRVVNHGAVLQAYALSRVLKSMGHDSVFLDFARSYDRVGGPPKRTLMSYCRARLPAFNTIPGKIFHIRKARVLDRFVRNRLDIGGFCDQVRGFDAVCIGSDEVFSLETGFTPLLFGLGIEAKSKFTYAASAGETSIENVYDLGYTSRIADGLNSLTSISVRDRNTYGIVKAITNREADIVIDPALLYDFADEPDDRLIRRKYMVVYAYTGNLNDPNSVMAMRRFANSHGLIIVSIGHYHGWCDRSIVATPLEFLSFMRHADHVVTDTYHGTVFSILFNRPFTATIRNNPNKLGHLIDLFGLHGRLVNTNADGAELCTGAIDYGRVNGCLTIQREMSMNYLRKAICSTSR